MPAAGPFFWSDLLTDEPAAAAAFWASTLDGEVRAAGATPLLVVGGRPVAQVLAAGDDAAPHWLLHLAVDDLGAACRRAAFLQGRVLIEPEPVEDLGAGALIADPADCVLYPFQHQHAPPGLPPAQPGHLVGGLLFARRVDLGTRFYTALLGWRSARLGPQLAGLTADGAPIALCAEAPAADAPPAQWAPIRRVVDADAAAARAVEAGGAVVVPAQAVAGWGRLVVLRDPWGALLSAVS